MGSGTTAVAALRLSRCVVTIDLEEISIDLALARVCAELVFATVIVVCSQNDLDLFPRSVDRSNQAMSSTLANLVRRERGFYFIGMNRRQVVYFTNAVDLDEAWKKFRLSSSASTEILFVIKTETEIYLAPGT